ncbi:MAG: transposase [Pirellulales bacterium]
MTRVRRHFTADQKAQVVRRHLAGKEAVSTLAEELGVQPTQIHQWVQQLLAQAERAFERTAGPRRTDEAKDRQIAQLQAKLADKHGVIAELLEEHVS